MSWKPVVQVGGESKWSENALRFATHAEALQSAKDLMNRWMLVTAYDAHESDDPVNYRFENNVLISVEKEAA